MSTIVVSEPLPTELPQRARWWSRMLQQVVNARPSKARLVLSAHGVAFDADFGVVVWGDVVRAVQDIVRTGLLRTIASPLTSSIQPIQSKLSFKCNWETDAYATRLFTKLFTPAFLRDELLTGWTLVVNAVRRVENAEENDPFLDPAKTIVLRMEPDTDQPGVKYWDEWVSGFEHKLGKADFAFWGDHRYHLNTIEWHFPLSFNEVLQLRSPGLDALSGAVSAVCSGLDNMPGHKWRLGLLRHWHKRQTECATVPKLHLWGKDGDLGMPSTYRGALPDHDKRAALLPYQYTFSAENCVKPNYATEKVWDALLSDTLCFYYGPDLSAWVEPDALVPLHHDYDTALAQISATVNARRYQSVHLPAIRRTKTALMTRWSLQCRVRDVVQWTTISPAVVVISLTSKPERLKRFSERAARAGLMAHRWSSFEAFEGLDPRSDWRSMVDLDNVIRPLRTGEIGCIASHSFVWKGVVASGRPALVFEDDCRFGAPPCWHAQTLSDAELETLAPQTTGSSSLTWCDQLLSAFSRLPDHWDWACIGWYCKPHCTTRRYEPRRNYGEWIPVQQLFRDQMDADAHNDGFGSFGGGAFAYFVSPTGARKLLSERAVWPLDYHMMHLAREGVAKHAFAYSAPFVHATIATASNDTNSDIQRSDYILLQSQAEKFKSYISNQPVNPVPNGTVA